MAAVQIRCLIRRGESKAPGYEDIQGFCKSVTLEEVKTLSYVVTPGRYVGLPDEEDDFNFAERFATLKAEVQNQIAEEAELNKRILENLAKIQIEEKIPL